MESFFFLVDNKQVSQSKSKQGIWIWNFDSYHVRSEKLERKGE